MTAGSGIEWTDRTWNPVRGCSRVSEGCRNCYAERIASRFWKPKSFASAKSGQVAPFSGFATADGWTGRVELVPEKLDEPLHWKKPRRVFVNSMSDLFHEKLSDGDIAAIFGIMGCAPQHTFQVLTKRADRAMSFLAGTPRPSYASMREWCFYNARDLVGETLVNGHTPWETPWPLPNVWLGVSVEDQATADERIPLLLKTPAAVRFVSAEPLLGPVNLKEFLWMKGHVCWKRGVKPTAEDVRAVNQIAQAAAKTRGGGWLDWVIVGGESGPGARPMDVAWARSIVAQCKAAGVACFVKQLGSYPAEPCSDECGCGRGVINDLTRRLGHRVHDVALRSSKGGDPAEWPEDLRVREFPA